MEKEFAKKLIDQLNIILADYRKKLKKYPGKFYSDLIEGTEEYLEKIKSENKN